ncbi:MAG: PCP reductase family protein [Nitrospirales bacterium]|nr:PCP reductase family protein [Nitrospirales bacterium]MBA3964933.1 PCP reductase family protein [Nitrospirales bacterium]
MQCDCHYSLRITDVEELPSDSIFAKFHCDRCGFSLGAEGSAKELDPVVSLVVWTDEALYQMSRLPPYLVPLVHEEVEGFVSSREQRIVTVARVGSARNKGMVEWNPDAERRIDNVPSGIRAMARIELERTALDRGMPAVTVALMEEVKARYFGMATGRT